MKKYEIRYLENVKKDLKKIDTASKKIIKKAIEEKLSIDPQKFGKPLQYSLKGARRLRVGDYRIIFKIEENEVIVLIIKIGHRKEVYEKI